jgi:hypothetical protein
VDFGREPELALDVPDLRGLKIRQQQFDQAV